LSTWLLLILATCIAPDFLVTNYILT
ncbi:MAG: hypothetical protein QOE41_2038, partial [Mycobacterium sp.]|nr:hypothetical protein [Mycobacterium sp.]